MTSSAFLLAVSFEVTATLWGTFSFGLLGLQGAVGLLLIKWVCTLMSAEKLILGLTNLVSVRLSAALQSALVLPVLLLSVGRAPSTLLGLLKLLINGKGRCSS